MQHSEIKCKFYRDAVNIVAVCVSSFCCRNQRTRIKKNGMKKNQLRETLFVCCLFAIHFVKSLTALLCWILRCVWSLNFFLWKSYISQQKSMGSLYHQTFDWKLPLFYWKLNFFLNFPNPISYESFWNLIIPKLPRRILPRRLRKKSRWSGKIACLFLKWIAIEHLYLGWAIVLA